MKKESQEPVVTVDPAEPKKDDVKISVSNAINVNGEVDTNNVGTINKKRGKGFSLSVKDDGEYDGKPKKPSKYYRIIFAERESESESRDIYMCLNGEDLLIKRGVEVIIPEGYYDIAKNAVVNSFKMNKDGTREPVVYRRFTYSVLGEATEEEYKALVAKCKAEVAEQKARDNK